jgi:hypothetical protein
MTTYQEQSFCREWARSASGPGALVDVGCWLGATTIALAQGLSASAYAQTRRVHAYDLFVWQEWMSPIAAGTPVDGLYAPGESFLPEFEARVAPWRSSIDVHVADLRSETWPGGEIQFLFVDAMKDPGLTAAIALGFLPSLTPGAVVVQQDYTYPWCPWIHLLMYRLRDVLVPLTAIEASYGVAFSAVGEITASRAEAAAADDATVDEADAAFGWAEALPAGPAAARVRAARLVWLVVHGQYEYAERGLDDGSLAADADAAAAAVWCREQVASANRPQKVR